MAANEPNAESGDELFAPTIKPMRSILVVGLWIAAVVIGLAILLPVIQRAREAARQSQSRNNLKQIGLALHNYHDTFAVFPPGGSIREDGTPHHGWMTSIMPYMDASPLYSMIDFDEAWDHPFNADLFSVIRQQPAFVNPSVSKSTEDDFYSVTHYLANPVLLYRNSSIGLEDLKEDASQTWLAGEIAGNVPPAAYPFNWRAWDGTTNRSQAGYGLTTKNVTQFLLVDGSVKDIRRQDSRGVWKRLNVKTVDFNHTKYAVPPVTFPIENFSTAVRSTSSNNASVDVIAVSTKDALHVRFREFRRKGDYATNITHQNIEFAAEHFPEAIHITVYERLTPEHLEALTSFKSLKELKTSKLNFDRDSLLAMKNLTHLKKIDLYSIDEETYRSLLHLIPGLNIDYEIMIEDSLD